MKERKIRKGYNIIFLFLSLFPLLSLVNFDNVKDEKVIVERCGGERWLVVKGVHLKDGDVVDCNGNVKDVVYNKDALVFGIKMDVNRVSCKDLMVVPGIGPVLAQRICSFRKEKGAFWNLNEILNVKGIGTKKLESIRKFVEVR